MSKTPTSLMVADLSPFARSLAKQLKEAEVPPSHLSLMNMLARASGFRNYQHLRASQASKLRLDKAEAGAVDFARVEKTLQQFDAAGRLLRWPSKRYVQELSLWALWSQLPRGDTLHERDVNGFLNKAHCFDDAAILRRSLVGMKLLDRKPDGSDYRRIEQSPPQEAVEVIRLITQLRG